MPRISANKLGEFLVTANPVCGLRILNGQKYPSDVVVPLSESQSNSSTDAPDAPFMNLFVLPKYCMA